MEENPIGDETSQMRTAAGHIHVGFNTVEVDDIYNTDHMDMCATLAKQLDYTLGLASVGLDSTERRKMYGKAGAFRPKPYGMEYRVLSNFWIQQECHIRLVYQNTKAAVLDLMQGRIHSKVYPDPQEAINEGDQDKAHYLLSQFGTSNMFLWQ